MGCHCRFWFIAILGLLCACSGGGSTATTRTLPGNPVVNAASGNARSVQLGLQPTSATLPVVSQITGTLLFPAVRTPTTIVLSASAVAPAGVGSQSVRHAQSGTLTVYEYVTIVSPISLTLPSIPAITLNFPFSTPLAGKDVFYGISDVDARGGQISFDTQGPGTLSGQTVAFAQVPSPITFAAGHVYTFVVYATTVRLANKIYVVNFNGNSVTTFNADGSRSTPTITGLSQPDGIAVDSSGKIYVSNAKTVTTYGADGKRTTPTISAGLSSPIGVAVDAAGKIYVADNGNNDVTTYSPDGSQTMPTISGPALDFAIGVAVDASGKIYVSAAGQEGNFNAVTSYNPDGSPTTPTIATQIFGLAVDATGKIYVADYFGNVIRTFDATGKPATPTITAGINGPSGVAVDGSGKIYVANSGNSSGPQSVTTYTADGSRTTPTITTGLDGPFAIAVH